MGNIHTKLSDLLTEDLEPDSDDAVEWAFCSELLSHETNDFAEYFCTSFRKAQHGRRKEVLLSNTPA